MIKQIATRREMSEREQTWEGYVSFGGNDSVQYRICVLRYNTWLLANVFVHNNEQHLKGCFRAIQALSHSKMDQKCAEYV